MKNLLISVLEQFCPGNVYLQGTLSKDEPYPEKFITFWTSGTEDNAHYDDDVESIDWSFYVYFYSSDPAEVLSIPASIRTALKDVGFIPQGKGYDIPSDVSSHTGWVTEYLYTEFL